MLSLLAVGLVGGVVALGTATGQGKSRRITPHEDLPAPNGEKVSPMIGSTTSGKNPAAFTAGDKVLPKPSVDKPTQKPKQDEPVMGTSDHGADRKTSMDADDKTGPDTRLQYVSVFNPDVLPFKRLSALDAAGETYQLKIARPALTEVRVGGVTAKDRDRFWGSVLVQLSPGVDVPLPSVAPDMRILSYEIKPKTTLKFEKDGADNFYVRSDESNVSGTYRLVFLADADAGYFAPSLPTTARLTPQMVQTMAPPELRPVIPDNVRRSAKITLDKIGIDASMDLGIAFNKLVGYFRAFEAKKLPKNTGDIYRDLCDSQAGVCRHRAFSFMITANVLGIPTRYIENEAHAFVEVWFPERRWQRIDLGGAALRMDVSGADNKTLHRPRSEDPFTKPKEYSENYTQLEGDITGLTDKQKDDRKRSLDDAPASGTFDGSLGSGSGSGSGGTAGPDRITPDPSLPAVTQDPKKQTPKLLVTTADTSAYRGDVVHVEGRVAVGTKAIADHPIDVFLAPAGRGGASPIPLGRAVSDANGRFSQDFTVPGSLNLATYEIYLASPEDAYYNASLSD